MREFSARISDIDQFGLMKIKFSQSVLATQEDLLNEANVSIVLTPSNDHEWDSDYDKNFTWEFVAWSRNSKEL